MEDVLIESECLQVPLNATASQLSCVWYPLTAARELLKRHSVRSAMSPLLLVLLLSSSVFGFIEGSPAGLLTRLGSLSEATWCSPFDAGQLLKLD